MFPDEVEDERQAACTKVRSLLLTLRGALKQRQSHMF